MNNEIIIISLSLLAIGLIYINWSTYYKMKQLLKGGVKNTMTSFSVKLAENGYIIRVKEEEVETVYVYQKKTSVDAKVKELLESME